jgi:hypothetical protein
MEMSRIKRTFRWIAERLKDIFYDTDNEHLDGARVIAYVAILSELWAVKHNMQLKQPIDLGPGGLGGGLTGILGAAAGFLAAKAWSKKKSRESAAIAQNVAVAVSNDTTVTPVEASPAPASSTTPTPVTVVNPPSEPVPTAEATPEPKPAKK